MTKSIKFSFYVICLSCLLSACNNNESIDNKLRISGKVEDELHFNSVVNLKSTQNKTLYSTISDNEGYYEINYPLQNNSEYIIESSCSINEINYSLRSQFLFNDEFKRIIIKNDKLYINSITDIQYLLLSDGYSYEDSEIMLRDYFAIFNDSNLNYISLKGLTYSYEGLQNICSVFKYFSSSQISNYIKDDILAFINEEDYKYRNEVINQNHLSISELEPKTNDLIEISLNSLDSSICQYYEIQWIGLPKNSYGNSLKKYFTESEPKESYISVNILRKKRENLSRKIIQSITTSLLFTSESYPITINILKENNNEDIVLLPTNNLSMSIPSGSLNEDTTITLIEEKGNKGNELAKIMFETTLTYPINFKYNYDPSVVLHPQNIRINLIINNTVHSLKIQNIDYLNHSIDFKVNLDSNNINLKRIKSTKSSISKPKIVIEYVQDIPKVEDVFKFISKQHGYRSYIKQILKFGVKNDDTVDAIYNKLISEEGLARLTNICEKKYKGDYIFNILARSVNNCIASEYVEKIYSKQLDWNALSRDCYNVQHEEMAWEGVIFKEYTENYYKSKQNIEDAVLSLSHAIATWVGESKLTAFQQSLIHWTKAAVGQAVALATISYSPETVSKGVKSFGFIAGLYKDTIFKEIINTDEKGYLYNAFVNSTESIIKMENKFSLTSWTVDVVVNEIASIVEEQLKESNAIASAPIFISMGVKPEKLEVINGKAKPFDRENFINTFFPEFENNFSTFNYNIISNHDYRDYYADTIIGRQPHWSGSQLSKKLDPNERLQNLILSRDIPQWIEDGDRAHNYGSFYPKTYDFEKTITDGLDRDIYRRKHYDNLGGYISDSERGLAFLLLKYAYGDEESKEVFDSITAMSKSQACALLLSSLFVKDNQIKEWQPESDTYCFIAYCRIITKQVYKVKSKYDITGSYLDLKEIYYEITEKRRSKKDFSNEDYGNSIFDISNYSSFEDFMNVTHLRIKGDDFENLLIHELKFDTISFNIEKENISENYNPVFFISSTNITTSWQANDELNKDMYTFDSEKNYYILRFSDIFKRNDFSLFDNCLLASKISLFCSYNGKDTFLSKDFIFTTAQDDTSNTEVEVPTNKLMSSVKNIDGNPIPKVSVKILPLNINKFTDENGNYSFEDLVPGNYTIFISKDGFSPVISTVEIVSGQDKYFETQLLLLSDATVKYGYVAFTARNALDGEVLGDLSVNVRHGLNNVDGQVIYNFHISDSDSYSLSLVGGSYTFELFKQGFVNNTFNTTIVGGETIIKDISLSPVLNSREMRIVLNWGESPKDLDAHLWKLNSTNDIQYHIYYSNKTVNGLADNLDYDYTNSYGPETITIAPIDNNSKYSYYVHNYSAYANRENLSSEICPINSSSAVVNAYFDNTVYTFYPPNEGGEFWKVFDIIDGEILSCSDSCMMNEMQIANSSKRISLSKKQIKKN